MRYLPLLLVACLCVLATPAFALPSAEQLDAAPSAQAPAVEAPATAAATTCTYREAVRQSNQQMRGSSGRWFPGKLVWRGMKGLRQAQVASVANRADRGRLIPQWRTNKTLARRGN